MRYPTRQLAHSLHLLRLTKSLLSLTELGEVAAEAVEHAVVRHDGPEHSAWPAVGDEARQLDVLDHSALAEPLQGCLGGRPILCPHEIEDAATAHLPFAPAGRAAPGWVHGADPALPVRYDLQHRRQSPDPVALAHLRLDLRLELFRPGLKSGLGALCVGDVVYEDVEAVRLVALRGPARHVADVGDAHPPVRPAPLALNPDLLARERAHQRLASHREFGGTQHLGDAAPDHGLRRLPEPEAVGGVREAVDEAAVHEGDEDRHGVGDEAQLRLTRPQGRLDPAALGDVVEQDRDVVQRRLVHPVGVDIVPAAERVRGLLEAGRLTCARDLAVGIEPVLLVVRGEFAHPTPGSVG
ncbi:hypothetical protein NBEOAGPD_1165 [Methylobacterium gregans]|uniref:Uncharacterized protein n=1 Tax=Methylobacterium gregans TaxID=374424 RepID=A0AA37HMM8_9HYPH|nr:hypothetical protein NBEOAGPD_1165 [Methylobacterium gregans]